jgi:DNA polymerase I-like protein with 3'-5' exonuclease and polymerase domains
MRGFAKAFVHGTNYGGSDKTMAAATGVTVREAGMAQSRWFQAHPGIKRWHNNVLNEIQTTRMIKNKLGYRWVIFDRIDTAFTEALAWVPQSTVACVINRGLVNIAENLPLMTRDHSGKITRHRNPETLLQVHDSLAGTMPAGFDPELIRQQLIVEIPYDPPLIIPASIEISPVSWGDCK